MERAVADLGALVGVDVGGGAGEAFQVLEHVQAAHHLVDGIGREQVVVDLIQSALGMAAVALRPFLRVAHGTHGAQVDGRRKVGLAVLLDEVGEGHVRRVGMAGMSSHDEREGADACGPEDVAVARRLGTALHCALVDGSELVHVVALVAAAACVHEREQACDEERRLVVRHGEGAGKDGAGFAVLLLAVAEEERVAGRVAVAEHAGLTDVDARERRAVLDAAAVLDDEVVGDDAVAHVDGSFGAAVEGSVLEAAGSFDLRVRAHVHVFYVASVDDGHVVADGAAVRRPLGGALGRKGFQALDEAWAVAVESLEVGLVGRHAVVDGHLAAARLVEHGHVDAITESRGAVAEDDVDVLDEAVVADVVVGYIVLDVLDTAVVADGHVVQRGVEDARVLVDAAGHVETLLEAADADVAREARVAYVLEALRISDLDALPVLGRTALLFQLLYL